jgi:hypothetical protein
MGIDFSVCVCVCVFAEFEAFYVFDKISYGHAFYCCYAFLCPQM